MSDIDRKYLFFYVKNFTGSYSTSGYTLPICPFTFIPVLSNAANDVISTTNMYWDFGDGTYSRDVTASHYYSMPGIYNVSCHFLSTSGEGEKSVFTQSILVKDFYSDTIALSAKFDSTSPSYATANPIIVSRLNSWQTYDQLSATGYNVILYANGANSPQIDLEEYNNDKYSHLKPRSKFLTDRYNEQLKQNETVPINAVTIPNDVALYVKLYNNRIVPAASTDTSAVLAGTSGQKVIYFTDDIPSPTDTTVSIIAYFDTLKFKDLDSYNTPFRALNLPILHQVKSNVLDIVIENDYTPSYLTITSNGIDGELTPINSFHIAPEKYVNQVIPFVVKLKDINNFTVKPAPTFTLVEKITDLENGNVYISIVNALGDKLPGIDIRSNFKSLSSEVYGGYFRGVLSASDVYDSIRIRADLKYNDATFTGYSSAFSILESSANKISKVNENFDAALQFQTYIFQESYQDYTVATKNFFGTILGDINSDPNTLGKKIYEKIANFTDNIAAIDTCNVDALNALCLMLDEDFLVFHSFNFNYPAEVCRLVDLFSIRYSKLRGGKNKYCEYFEDKGFSVTSNTKFGRNKGKELDLLTTVLTANSAALPIIAYEKFSETYTLLNTFLLSGSYIDFIDTNLLTYSLSSYDKRWGWGLVLPQSYTPNDIEKYYNFYEYVSGYDNSQLEGMINYSDTLNTVKDSISSIEEWDTLRESIITYALKKGLGTLK